MYFTLDSIGESTLEFMRVEEQANYNVLPGSWNKTQAVACYRHNPKSKRSEEKSSGRFHFNGLLSRLIFSMPRNSRASNHKQVFNADLGNGIKSPMEYDPIYESHSRSIGRANSYALTPHGCRVCKQPSNRSAYLASHGSYEPEMPYIGVVSL